MGLGVFFQEDLANIMRGVASAGVAYGPVYQRAIGDLALALGLTRRTGTAVNAPVELTRLGRAVLRSYAEPPAA